MAPGKKARLFTSSKNVYNKPNNLAFLLWPVLPPRPDGSPLVLVISTKHLKDLAEKIDINVPLGKQYLKTQHQILICTLLKGLILNFRH